MAKEQQVTPVRMIIDNFIINNAINEKNAISIEKITAKLKDKEKEYILNELIRDEYVVRVDDGRVWFNQGLWNKKIKKLTAQYSAIMAIPFVVAGVIYFIFRKFL